MLLIVELTTLYTDIHQQCDRGAKCTDGGRDANPVSTLLCVCRHEGGSGLYVDDRLPYLRLIGGHPVMNVYDDDGVVRCDVITASQFDLDNRKYGPRSGVPQRCQKRAGIRPQVQET